MTTPTPETIKPNDQSPSVGAKEKCSPSFAQEYMGTFTKPQARAKVGDMVSNRCTGHRSKIVEALDRADGGIYAILESRIHCVIPSPNWEILENAKTD